MIEINNPGVHAEITDAFWRYTHAIVANDIDTVISLFWNSKHTLRYGPDESLYGIDAIAAFRNTQRGRKIELEITRLVITSFGRDFGTANCEMQYLDNKTTARMSHAWVRMAEGWQIVAAQVSADPSE